MKTHYQSLGISRDASAAQIRDAYQHGMDELVLAQQYATEEELKIRRLVLRDAHHVLSAPVRRQHYDARLDERRIGRDQATHRRSMRRGILWLLIVGILTLGAYVRPQHVADPVPDLRKSMLQGELVRVPVPVTEAAMHEARLQSRRKAQMRGKLLAEELRAQQIQREQMPPPIMSERQQTGSAVDPDANPAR